MERLGEARRVHGGAVSTGQRLDEQGFNDKAATAREEKRRIAKAAFGHIQPRDTLFLDGGSTVLELARLLHARTDITVVTNSLQAALELASKGPKLILAGGELRRLSQTMVGAMTRFLLEQFHFDKAFMGTLGLSVEEGLTTTAPDEAFTKELVMRRAQEVILLADSGKQGVVTFSQAGQLKDIDLLITDANASPAMVQALSEQGVRVTQV